MKIQTKTDRSAAIVKIGVSRQVAIPKKLHDRLGLAPGDYLEIALEGDRLILTPKALIEKRLVGHSMTHGHKLRSDQTQPATQPEKSWTSSFL